MHCLRLTQVYVAIRHAILVVVDRVSRCISTEVVRNPIQCTDHEDNEEMHDHGASACNRC